jgi:hypothetical protein
MRIVPTHTLPQALRHFSNIPSFSLKLTIFKNRARRAASSAVASARVK